MMRDEENFCLEWPVKANEANASQLNKRSQWQVDRTDSG
jgi:hypothetical protein